jgi:hypothetical protein
MKVAAFVFLLTICGAVMQAQTSAAPTGDLTIEMNAGSPQYCLGPTGVPLLKGRVQGPDDISIRLPLKLLYENQRLETIFLPSWIRFQMRMTVAGQNGSNILRSVGGGGMDVKTVMAMSTPDARFFLIIAGGKYVWPPEESIVFPVLERSSGLDLRGKTIQLVMTRDFRSLTPDVVEKVNQKWKDSGTVWAGVVESKPMTFRIPEEPLTRNCTTK